MTYTIITRDEAKAKGLPRYFPGEPCRRGHVAERYAVGGHCVPCRAMWMEKNAEHFKAKCKAYHVEWYADNRERKLAANKAIREATAPEVKCAYTRKWQAKNPEKAKAYAAKWYADPENRAAHSNKRRALVRNAGGTHTPADLVAILTSQGHRCAYCAADLRVVRRHVDHIKPLARGGSNGRDNLQYLCAPCNLRKGAKEPEAR